jgi:hypothetical protein
MQNIQDYLMMIGSERRKLLIARFLMYSDTRRHRSTHE